MEWLLGLVFWVLAFIGGWFVLALACALFLGAYIHFGMGDQSQWCSHEEDQYDD